MKPQHTLKAVPSNDQVVTRQEIALAEIHQSWREYRGLNGGEWVAYSGSTDPWSGKISETLDRGRYIVKPEPKLPLWRRIFRKFRKVGDALV